MLAIPLDLLQTNSRRPPSLEVAAVVEYGPGVRRQPPLRLVQLPTLIQPLTGSISLRIPATRSALHVRPGEALLLRAGAHDLAEHPTPEGELKLRFVSLGAAALEYGLPLSLLRDDLGDEAPEPTPLRYATATLPESLRRRLDAFPTNREVEDLADNALAVFAPLVGDLAEIGFTEVLATSLRSGRLDACARLRQLMAENVHMPLTLEDYATLCTRSTSSFKRDFQRAFEMPPGRWITDARLRRAREMLRDRDVTVAEVALLSGYADASSFIRSFRRHFEITPKRYQLRHARREQGLGRGLLESMAQGSAQSSGPMG